MFMKISQYFVKSPLKCCLISIAFGMYVLHCHNVAYIIINIDTAFSLFSGFFHVE